MAITKDKKRNTWLFRVYVEDKFGNKKQISKSGFRTKGEAKEEEAKFLNESQREYSDITFQELYDIYIISKKQNLKSQSLRSTISRYKNYVLPFFKDYKICKIDHKIYLDWKEKIIIKDFSYKYNSSLHGSVVSILNYAMSFYGLENNIASKVGNFSKKAYLPKVDFWTYEEFMKFINVVDDNLYSTLYKTLYYTGMRLGESLALNWHDIRGNYIEVSKTISKEHINGKYDITTPKTKKSNRKILLDDETIKLLEDLKSFYKLHIGFNEDWFIFGGLKPMSQTTVNRRKDEYCLKANVKRIRIHDLRHSHATLLLSKGVPITVISKRLGHADMTMTLNTYSHLIPEDEDKAINIINNLNKTYENNNSQENFERTEKVDTKKSLQCKDLLSKWSGKQDLNLQPPGPKPGALPSCAISRYGAPDKSRTHNLLIRSQVLYPIELRAHLITGLIYFWWLRLESNQRHEDFQSSALPTELQSHIWRFQRDSDPRSSA